MSAKQPKTLAEWKAYTDKLDDAALHQEARAANCAEFVRSLQQEGYAAAEIHAIFVLYAHRFKAVGLRPPTGGLYDLIEMMDAPVPVAL